MKTIVIMLAGLLMFHSASAESCLPNGITFSTQAQVNSFQANNPNCTQIEGDVIICGYNISNLDGLNVVTSIGGSLVIQCNQILPDLSGLENLASVGGNLTFTGNISLTSLDGLNNLAVVGTDLVIQCNDQLVDLSGLGSLSSVGGMLWIDDNDMLASLNGLTSLAYVTGLVRICSNPSLESLAGLEGLDYIGGSLIIGGQGHLGSLGNPLLADLTGLNNLISVGGNLDIGFNASLVSLNGLDNVTPESIYGMFIYFNDALSNCAIQSVCGYLGNPTGIIDIHDNAPGCSNIGEVSAACEGLAAGTGCTKEGFSLYPNPSGFQVTIETREDQHRNQMTVYNVNGRVVMKRMLFESRTVIDITPLPHGVYLVSLVNDRSVHMARFIKL